MLNWSEALACPHFRITSFNTWVHCEDGEDWDSVLSDLPEYHDGPDIAREVSGSDRDPQDLGE